MRRKVRLPLPTDPLQSAQIAGLRYVSDSMPGIRRKRAGKAFVYVGPDGRRVTDKAVLKRIRSLVIPPAWENVWICPLEKGHLQATGRDAKGRKQHRYHPFYRTVRDQLKYSRMAAFGQALPGIRRRVLEDLARPGLPKEKVLATVVRLLETTLIRVGNDEYVKQNDSYGLTTMEDGHAKISGPKIRFRFRGKSGKEHDVELTDQRLARIVKRCQDLPGEQLFQYVDADGQVQDVTSEDVNGYLREITGQDFTAKDFRTWKGTVLAALTLGKCEPCTSETQIKKNVVAAVKEVAEKLGNRPSTCRKYYMHPAVLEAYSAGRLLDALKPAGEVLEAVKPAQTEALTPVEGCVMRLLREEIRGELGALKKAG